jgi:hypothetical protein
VKQLFGKYRAQVDDNVDPQGRGRVEVSSRALGTGASAWAEPCLPYSGPGHGFLMLPAVGSSVWIEFEEGDRARPIWTGCLWDPNIPPASAHTVSVAHSSGATVTFEPSGVSITSPSKLVLQAGTVELSAGMVQVAAGMVKVGGVVQCDTLITNSVVAASYTPGAGNIW